MTTEDIKKTESTNMETMRMSGYAPCAGTQQNGVICSSRETAMESRSGWFAGIATKS